MNIKDIAVGTRVKVTVEGKVVGSSGNKSVLSDNGMFQLYDNVLDSAEIEVVKNPIKAGDFFSYPGPSRKFIGLATKDGYTIVRDNSGLTVGSTYPYDHARLDSLGYAVISAEEAGRRLAGTDIGTDKEWE